MKFWHLTLTSYGFIVYYFQYKMTNAFTFESFTIFTKKFTNFLHEYLQGIITNVTIGGSKLSDWEMTGLCLDQRLPPRKVLACRRTTNNALYSEEFIAKRR
ncbi:hypothetical protein Anas_10829 [Armadillidium nasatum]|uniref:Uncharacterized protein n=1 Tax=Armadillidium nasatum TaxID=96803 RepID=A0A5N5TAE6_9CRUS|nr:hypothetical protein Anas_10829 [Armadillidium nasatum]